MNLMAMNKAYTGETSLISAKLQFEETVHLAQTEGNAQNHLGHKKEGRLILELSLCHQVFVLVERNLAASSHSRVL